MRMKTYNIQLHEMYKIQLHEKTSYANCGDNAERGNGGKSAAEKKRKRRSNNDREKENAKDSETRTRKKRRRKKQENKKSESAWPMHRHVRRVLVAAARVRQDIFCQNENICTILLLVLLQLGAITVE